MTGITGHPETGFVFNAGSEVEIRKARAGDPNAVSHIIVPPGCELPPDFVERR